METTAMEATLTALDGREAAMRGALFDRFLDAYPAHRELFLHREATSVRMTDETLQWMLGLARGEKWVWGQVAELVYQHRNYGRIPAGDYAAFVAMTVDALRDATGDAWSPAAEAAWRDAAAALTAMLARAVDEWTAAPVAYP